MDQVLLKELLAHLRLMEDVRSQPKWAAAYSKFIEGVANHMTVIWIVSADGHVVDAN